MADEADLFRRSLPFSHLISAPGKELIPLKLMPGAEILIYARRPFSVSDQNRPGRLSF